MSLYTSPEAEGQIMAGYEAIIRNWPVTSETRMLATRHGETFVIINGKPEDPAMILLHGAGSNSSSWAGDIGAFSEKYRVYALDLLGEAGKSSPNRPEWDSPAFAEWLEDILNALQLEKASFVGLSQGAWVALKFAIAMPERVEKLLLIAPAGIIPDKASFLPRAIFGRLFGMKAFVRSLFGAQPIPESVVEAVTFAAKHFKPRIGIVPVFTDEDLRRLRMPTLLLGGTRDIARDNEKIAARLKLFLPQLSVKIIPDAGHALLNINQHAKGFL